MWIEKETNYQNAKNEIKALFGNSEIFDFPKPTYIVSRLSTIITEEQDIILDFFSGSATTAHAVMKLNAEDGGNRKFIMVQLPEKTDEKSEAYKAGYKNICEIGKERIRRAAKKIKGEHPDWNGDMGFKVFKLDIKEFYSWVKRYCLKPLLLHKRQRHCRYMLKWSCKIRINKLPLFAF